MDRRQAVEWDPARIEPFGMVLALGRAAVGALPAGAVLGGDLAWEMHPPVPE